MEVKTIVVRVLKSLDRCTREWDAFGAKCGYASFVGALRYAQFIGCGSLVTVEVFLQQGDNCEKIGQAAIACRNSQKHLLDGLKLLPDYEDRWPETIQELLNLLGPGRYRYGCKWSGEPSRQEALASMSGVHIENVHPFYVYVIDFTRWASWNDYVRGLNRNVQRSLRKAAALSQLQIDVATGWRAGTQINLLNSKRRATLLRKGIARHPVLWHWGRVTIRYLLRVAALGRRAFMAIARDGTDVRAIFSGVEFGPATFYMEGASSGANDGISWHLLIAMIERSYHRHSKGRFVMGHEDEDLRTSIGWDNLVRSRLQCQAKPSLSDEITFYFAGKSGST